MINLKQTLNISIILTILIVGAWVYFNKQPTKNTVNKTLVKTDPAEKYLKDLSKKINVDKKIMELKLQSNIKKEKELKAEESSLAIAPGKQIHRANTQTNLNLDPKSQLNSGTFESSSMSKEEYIRQYKENALKDGYEIEFNDQLDIISVKPIGKKHFDQNKIQNSGSSEF